MRADPVTDVSALVAHDDPEALRDALRGVVADLQAMSLRIARVAEIAVSVSRSLSVSAILDVLWRQTKWVVGFDHFVVVRELPSGGWQTEWRGRARDHGGEPPPDHIDDDTPLARALRQGQPGIYTSARIPGRDPSFSSVMVVPLHVERDVVGAFAFGRGGAPYTVDDLRVVTMMALQTAAMFRNASRFEQLQVLASDLDAANAMHRQALCNVIPSHLVEELTREGRVRPVRHEAATVAFVDLVGFTTRAAALDPEEVVSTLDRLFYAFDIIVERRGIEKLKTIGDAYMYVSGVTAPDEHHARRAVQAALDILAHVASEAAHASLRGEHPWQVRIGVHSGPLMAGVVGRNRLAYDVWGDTVNVAARLESSGVPGRVNISRETYDLVAPHFRCTPRGNIAVKGRGELPMFLVGGVTAPMRPVGPPPPSMLDIPALAMPDPGDPTDEPK